MTRRNLIKNVIGGVVIIVLVFWVRSCSPPSQRSVVRRFERNRESFEKVRAMLAEDSDVRIAAFWGFEGMDHRRAERPEDVGLSTQRYNEYRRLLRKAGAGSVIRDEDQIRFHIAGSGFGSHGWRLAIAYRDGEPNNVIGSLSEFKPDGTSAGGNIAYCPIVDHWYIWIIW